MRINPIFFLLLESWWKIQNLRSCKNWVNELNIFTFPVVSIDDSSYQ